MAYTMSLMNLGMLGLDQALLRFYREPPRGATGRGMFLACVRLSLLVMLVVGAAASLFFAPTLAVAFGLGQGGAALVPFLFLNAALYMLVRYINVLLRLENDVRAYTVQTLWMNACLNLIYLLPGFFTSNVWAFIAAALAGFGGVAVAFWFRALGASRGEGAAPRGLRAPEAGQGVYRLMLPYGLLLAPAAILTPLYRSVCLSFLAAGVVTWVLGRLHPQVPQLGRAWVQLDRAALIHNVAALRALLPPGCQLMPAVKADAYGHGALPVARILLGEGVSAFCVACLSEGIQLRKGGIRGEILILGYTHPDQFPLLRRYRLSQTVVDAAYARQLAAYGRTLSVHLAVDTGMHRLGEASGHLEEIRQIFALPSLRIQGIYTHLCTADGTTSRDQAYVHRQAQAFRELLERLQNQGIALPKVHLLASHGLLNYPDLGGDYARVGIALYGLLSTREDRNLAAPDLRPVLSLRARVASVKTLSPGCAAGYGLAFVAQRPTKVAVLAIGYADGLPRTLTGGQVLLHGCRAPIVGRICMDQTLVDVTEIPAVDPGDVAVLLGTSGQETITAYDLAQQAGTITNEILSRLGPRLERIVR